MVPTRAASDVAGIASPQPRNRSDQSHVALQVERLVSTLSVPSVAGSYVPPLADVYRLWGLRRSPFGHRHGTLRALGERRPVTAALVEALSLEQLVKAQACGLGFDLVGITSLGPMETADAFDDC